jgi:hypothetical protein
LAIARRVVTRCTTGGRAGFKTPGEFDAAFKREAFRLVVNEAFGPVHPDARQLIYESPDRMVTIKVKTKGYPNGMRPGGTMSIEITNGTGTAWKDVLCKVDVAGDPIPSNVITPDKLVETAEGRSVRRATGKFEEIMPHEVVLERHGPAFDGDLFANRGHFDFLPGFDPRGAAALRPC